MGFPLPCHPSTASNGFETDRDRKTGLKCQMPDSRRKVNGTRWKVQENIPNARTKSQTPRLETHPLFLIIIQADDLRFALDRDGVIPLADRPGIASGHGFRRSAHRTG